MKKIALVSTLFALLLGGCKNDLDINAPWKEIPVVYGLLDPNTTTQDIRVEKAYQTSPDKTVSQVAQIPDSIYFDSIYVTVWGSDGSGPYVFNKTEVPKDPGYFGTDKHYIYRNTSFAPNPGLKYSLKIYSPKTGNTYTSLNPEDIVNSAAFNGSNTVNVRPKTPADTTGGSVSITFDVGTNASRYDVIIRFGYKEFPAGEDPNNYPTQYLDWTYEHWDVSKSKYLGRIRGTEYISFLQTNMPNAPAGYNRKYNNIDYNATGGSAELALMVDISQPSTSVVQKKTEYTNLNGGLGIFSSRCAKTVSSIDGGVSVTPSTISTITDALRNKGFID